jgi:hypothetical protein
VEVKRKQQTANKLPSNFDDQIFDWNMVMKHEFLGRATLDFARVLGDASERIRIWVPLRKVICARRFLPFY